jgi:hypothetical protein
LLYNVVKVMGETNRVLFWQAKMRKVVRTLNNKQSNINIRNCAFTWRSRVVEVSNDGDWQNVPSRT